MRFRNLDILPSAVNDEHRAWGLPPVEDTYSHPDRHPVVRTAVWVAASMLLAAAAFVVWRFSQQGDVGHNLGVVGDALKRREFWSAVLVGLLAQTVDGALGMAYGITSTSPGGGGWGPVVTTTLVGTGHDPRTTIGSVNFAEFFLTFASAIAFSVLIDEGSWLVVAGLVLGGLFAAPFAALLVSRIAARKLLIVVGVLISAISAFNLWQALS